MGKNEPTPKIHGKCNLSLSNIGKNWSSAKIHGIPNLHLNEIWCSLGSKYRISVTLELKKSPEEGGV